MLEPDEIGTYGVLQRSVELLGLGHSLVEQQCPWALPKRRLVGHQAFGDAGAFACPVEQVLALRRRRDVRLRSTPEISTFALVRSSLKLVDTEALESGLG